MGAGKNQLRSLTGC